MLFLSIFCCLIACLIVSACWRLRESLPPGAVPSELQLTKDPSVSTAQFYRPMERLLADDDFEFLSRRTDMGRDVLNKMRADRRRIFRQYLFSISTDFSDLTSRLRAIMVDSPHSREDLAATIFKSRVLFAAALVVIEGRLFLHACGVCTIRISARNLVEGLAQMQRELEQLTKTPALLTS